MRIVVKHKNTEVVIEDGETKTDTNSNLIYYNQKYLLELLDKIFKEIKELNNEQKETKYETIHRTTGKNSD